ncbi:nitrous oxide reductase accessory protein NosL (plasmid) [Haloferax mediterranei ATCC 33500]|uniref:NosL n=1 Tax=Haloferax mediterranei (strain ATCC 33500 / DSM 1411 / JCM 8866 / NBRC 14739 / NCIMB 2177 / R-4) TaxID=523841 RepID=I3RB11_HALMT|nr:nitrous oxide reductase accessory protein NosL [Haloferax mediterranei]AFK21421.2 Cu(I) protein of the nitrous oxide reductase (nos) gene cluster (NosL) [Haloferax mediterranei ATCC 33500]AHZ24509.1 NosL [Haloferax mediterranei ATCC 33500]ELZ97261.1 NosL [Haloferax mediterranei ATCC 33500]MDX5990437.1 nitrous oxide reductase accessory protein NosL [Haloferax mediterranei ATCC 33500]QCQ77090.1 nitrous oxide reductase accessory protein NosL [Haloferax mediterranei ATCC 33500]
MPDDIRPGDQSADLLTRRAATKAFSLGTLATLAGCLGTSSETKPDPVDLSGQKEDDQGGMVIGLHAGPNGQIFYRDSSPEGHDNPAWFHTLSMGMFPYYFEHQQQGWEATAIYVTDYSVVEYELTEEEGDTFISTHTGADTFGNAREMTYVVGSEVLGGMGKDLIPFSSSADADAFIDEHGGSTVTFDDVTSSWLSGYMRS